MLARLHSPDIAGEDPEHPGERTWAIIIAILIPIAVAVILSGVYMQRGDVSQLSQLRQDIRAAFAEAETAVSLNEIRDLTTNRYLPLRMRQWPQSR